MATTLVRYTTAEKAALADAQRARAVKMLTDWYIALKIAQRQGWRMVEAVGVSLKPTAREAGIAGALEDYWPGALEDVRGVLWCLDHGLAMVESVLPCKTLHELEQGVYGEEDEDGEELEVAEGVEKETLEPIVVDGVCYR